jgi:hypothetical protein
MWIKSLEETGKKVTWPPIQATILPLLAGTEESHDKLIRVAGVPADI